MRQSTIHRILNKATTFFILISAVMATGFLPILYFDHPGIMMFSILVCCFSLLIISNGFKLSKKNISKDYIALSLILLSLVIPLLWQEMNRFLTNLIGVLVILSIHPRFFRSMRNIYLVSCVLFSIGAVLAFYYVNISGELIELNNFSAFEYSSGKTSSAFALGGSSYGYSRVGYLGLVMTGSYLYQVFIPIWRGTGWFLEPNSFAFFLGPAFYMFYFQKSINFIFRAVLLLIIVSGMLSTFSGSSFVGFLLAMPIMLLSHRFFNKLARPFKIFFISTIVAVTLSVLVFFFAGAEYASGDGFTHGKNLISSKIISNPNNYFWFLDVSPWLYFLYFYTVTMFGVLSISRFWRYMRVRVNVGSAFMVLSTFIYSSVFIIKGNWYHILGTLFPISIYLMIVYREKPFSLFSGYTTSNSKPKRG
jgi:hypothetical protein